MGAVIRVPLLALRVVAVLSVPIVGIDIIANAAVEPPESAVRDASVLELTAANCEASVLAPLALISSIAPAVCTMAA
jgi:hypothetical protein